MKRWQRPPTISSSLLVVPLVMIMLSPGSYQLLIIRPIGLVCPMKQHDDPTGHHLLSSAMVKTRHGADTSTTSSQPPPKKVKKAPRPKKAQPAWVGGPMTKLGEWLKMPHSEYRRFLAPFLTTRELLRLSVCSVAMRDWRSFLTNLTIKHTRTPKYKYPCVEEALKKVISEQKHVKLHVGKRLMRAMLEFVRVNQCDGVKGLDLDGLGDHELQLLADILRERRCPGLEELTIRLYSGLREDRSAEALAAGACSGLRRLTIDGNYSTLSVVPFANALRSGACRGLQELSLLRWWMGKVVVALGEAFEAGTCPELKVLTMSSCLSDVAGSLALARALESGSLPRLEQLSLPSSGLDVERLAGVLQAGGAPGLKCLDLSSNGQIGEAGGAALARMLDAGSCPGLEMLDVGFNNIRDHVGTVLMRALSSASPHLRKLNLCQNHIGDGSIQVVAEALHDNKWPYLEVLRFRGNEVGDGGISQLAAALEGGGGANLRELGVSMNRFGLEGETRLVEALERSEVCPMLECLTVSDKLYDWSSVVAGRAKRVKVRHW